jgi:transposase InsO family protein
LLEDLAERQTQFYREIEVVWLTARGCSAWSRPQIKRVVTDPNRQITTQPKAFVVFRPVGHPMLLLRDLRTAISVELGRHLQHPQRNRTHPISACRRSLQQRRITASYRRPRVSNDNPFSEALFRTCKYRPEWPGKGFATKADAQAWVETFAGWYNSEHLHSANRTHPVVVPRRRIKQGGLLNV